MVTGERKGKRDDHCKLGVGLIACVNTTKGLLSMTEASVAQCPCSGRRMQFEDWKCTDCEIRIQHTPLPLGIESCYEPIADLRSSNPSSFSVPSLLVGLPTGAHWTISTLGCP